MLKARSITPATFKVTKRANPLANYNAKTGLDERIADLEKKQIEITNKIARMKEIREIWDKLPFKEGDVAFHPEHGNVIVRSIEYGSKDSDFEDIKYVIVTSRAATVKVSYKDVIAISEATKVLYGKNDERSKANG